MKVLVLAASRHSATGEIAEALGARLRARGHDVDVGDPATVATRAERLLTKLVHAPDGDFRDWDDVSRWSDEIADVLA